MFEVLVSHEADKYYKKQDRDAKRRINKCIDNLSRQPLANGICACGKKKFER